jgi:hypothetical protein
MPQTYNLDIYRGDSEHWTFTLFTDAGGTSPYDLTGVTAKAEMRIKPGDPVLTALACTVTLPNTVEVDLPAVASKALTVANAAWDLQLTWPTGQVKTVVVGSVKVTPDITDSAAALFLATAQPQTAEPRQRRRV